MKDLQIKIVLKKNIIIVLTGALSYFSFGKIILIYEELEENIKKNKNVVLDTKGLSYIDEYGIMALFHLKMRIEKNNRDLFLLKDISSVLTGSNFLSNVRLLGDVEYG